MREVFQGWRRKTGCVTLLMALAVLAAWGRSQISADTITIPLAGEIQYQASLHDAGFCFQTTRTIELGKNECLNYRNGDIFIARRSDSTDDNENGPKAESQPDGNAGLHVLAIKKPGLLFILARVLREIDQDADDDPQPNSNGDVRPQSTMIPGAATVLVDCGQMVVPYWYLITPLTLISAMLLITRSRVAATKKSFELINDKNE